MDPPPDEPVSKLNFNLDKLKARLSRKPSSASLSPSQSFNMARRTLAESYDFCDDGTEDLDAGDVKYENQLCMPRPGSSMNIVGTPTGLRTPSQQQQPDIWEKASMSQANSKHDILSSSHHSLDGIHRSVLITDKEDIHRFLRELPLPSNSRSAARRNQDLDTSSQRTAKPLGRSVGGIKDEVDKSTASYQPATSKPGSGGGGELLGRLRRHPNDQASLSPSVLTSSLTDISSPRLPSRASSRASFDYVGKWLDRLDKRTKSRTTSPVPSTPTPPPMSPALTARSISNVDVPKELRLSLGTHAGPEEALSGEKEKGGEVGSPEQDAKSESSLDVLLRAEAKRLGANALTERNVARLEPSWMGGSVLSCVPRNDWDSVEPTVDEEVEMDEAKGDGLKMDGSKMDEAPEMGEKPKVDEQKLDAPKVDEPKMKSNEPKTDEEPTLSDKQKAHENDNNEPNPDGKGNSQLPAQVPKPTPIQTLTLMHPTTVLDQPPLSSIRARPTWNLTGIALIVVHGALLTAAVTYVFRNFGDDVVYEVADGSVTLQAPGLVVGMCGVLVCLHVGWMGVMGGFEDGWVE
ncbi:uncharacterized protein EI97DRAFT_462922 [Westerdykella ornata]|uniref:Uncharacterized protein n=1 Tax=Westerdykella ornata TaxID=318751 RepID=A0A6A6J574_WESOR|nr:uncharacterized protein EI97DRAFT_462922 [Westerdykella ornata]KAF2271337.1 hypothetical protein EI97DRAFT_462922 [Westerdykella ornata]